MPFTDQGRRDAIMSQQKAMDDLATELERQLPTLDPDSGDYMAFARTARGLRRLSKRIGEVKPVRSEVRRPRLYEVEDK